MRTKDVSFLTAYSEYQIRRRAQYLLGSGLQICTRVKAPSQFDDYSVSGVEILNRCKFEEQENGLPPKIAAERAAIWWKNRSDLLSISPGHSAEMGPIRLILWMWWFEGWSPARQRRSRQPSDRDHTNPRYRRH